jgi:hypothetical protein
MERMVKPCWILVKYKLSLQFGQTPFEIFYCNTPRHFGINVVDSCVVPDLKAWLSERKLIVQLLQQQLLRVQQRQKHQADKRRTERSFVVGDMVFLRSSHMFSLHCKREQTINWPSSTLAHILLLRRLAKFIQVTAASIGYDPPSVSCLFTQEGCGG